MNTTFIINGGAGRAISAIPALLKYGELNPEDDYKVLVHGWSSLYWSHPILQEKTFDAHQKGIFEMFVKSNRIVCPEPYYVHGYYNQELSMAEAFDVDINNTEDHSNLPAPKLYLSRQEERSIDGIIENFKREKNKKKLVVFQPYGSAMMMLQGRPFDNSHRSLDVDDYLSIVKELSKDAVVIFFGPPELRHPEDTFSVDLSPFNPDLRMFLSFISRCDYFVGVDSVGQHMARCMDKNGLVIMGSTFEKNVSYPDYKGFKFFRKQGQNPKYNPIRITGPDSEFTDRMNSGIMDFSSKEINEICKLVREGLKK